jgi:hypothetical protein
MYLKECLAPVNIRQDGHGGAQHVKQQLSLQVFCDEARFLPRRQ